MSTSAKEGLFNIARLYQFTQRMYSALPYHFFHSGYAFPAWHYYFEVTRRCNLRCKMCQYIEWLEHAPLEVQKEGELSTEEWINVIDQVHRFSLISFTGGEPFMRKDFLELLRYASARARTHVISNTTMLTEERAAALVDLAPNRFGGRGFNFIGTSLEGPSERHDEIRQLNGAFERSSNGIKMLLKYRDQAGKPCPMVHVTTVIQKDNVDILPQMPKLMKALGVDVWNLVTETRMFDLPGFGEVDPKTFKAADIQWPRIDRKILAQSLDDASTAAHAEGLDIRLPRMPLNDLLDYYDCGLKLRDYECRSPWNTLIIGRQGDVYPCWIQKAGNIRENTLREIWNNETMRDFRQTCQRHLFAMCPGCCFLEHKKKR